MKYSLKNLCKIDPTHKHISLSGRKYISPEDLSAKEMKCLLMTAIELKSLQNTSSFVQCLVGKSITFLLDVPCLRLQTCLHSTSNLLKMPLNTLIDSEWETLPYPQDIGRLLSTTSDIIFCKAHRQRKLKALSEGSRVPVINVSSCRFMLLQILSDLLTIQQHFGSLEGLVIAWVGTPCPMLNTYLLIAPILNMEINFLCRCGGPVSPSALHHALSRSVGKVKECKDLNEAIKGAHVIITTDQREKNLKVKLVDLEMYAHKNWVFFHTFPRTFADVEDEIFDSERNLVWTSYMNNKWICAAIITQFLNVDANINMDKCME